MESRLESLDNRLERLTTVIERQQHSSNERLDRLNDSIERQRQLSSERAEQLNTPSNSSDNLLLSAWRS